MEEALAAFLAHPLRAAPYTAIRFARCDHNGVPLFLVGTKEAGGALSAMKAAHSHAGSSCFYCGKPMARDGDKKFTLDHLRPKSSGGTDDLHNLVFCCRPCNRSKGVQPLAVFHPGRAADYVAAMDHHNVRALGALNPQRDASAARNVTGATVQVVKIAAAG